MSIKMFDYLSLMPDGAKIASHDDLWLLIELSAKESHFEMCDALLFVWRKDIDDSINRIDATERIGQFLLRCINDHETHLWYIYRMMKKYQCEHLLHENHIQLKLIIRNEFQLNEQQMTDIIEMSKFNHNQYDERNVLIIRNMILHNAKMAHLVIDMFNDGKSLNYLYSQCLIHSLKNQNKTLILEILSVIPDEEICEKSVKLLEEICDQFLYDNDDDIMRLYWTGVLRKTPKLIDTICRIRRNKRRESIYDRQTKQFNFKECFLLASYERKHFIIELLNDSQIPFEMPPKLRLLFLLYSIHKTDLKIDTFVKIETEIYSLINCDTIKSIAKSDAFVNGIIKRLNFIFKMVKWCLNRESNVSNKTLLKFNLFQSLLRGEMPLKVLHKYKFLDNYNFEEFNSITSDELTDLISDYSECELMIYRGFLAIRLSIMWIVMTDNDTGEDIDLSDKILDILRNLKPIRFRVEIMENIFSLLFLTQNELTENDGDDEEYIDDSVNKSSDTRGNSASSSITVLTYPTIGNLRSTHFLCPNLIVHEYLLSLRTAAMDSQGDLVSLKRNFIDAEDVADSPHLNILTSIKDLNECKIRLNNLTQHISVALWRYDLIEPAFHKNFSHHMKKSDSAIEMNEIDDDCDALKESFRGQKLMSVGSTSGSEYERSPKEIFTSMISCMMASPHQLLRYSLIEEQIDRAKQVIKLFEKELSDSEELLEVTIVDKWNEFGHQLCLLSTPQRGFSRSISRIGEIAAIGLKTTQIQSLVHEFLLNLKCEDRVKNCVILDFALTASPSLEISKVILETVLLNLNSNDLPQPVNTFLHNIRTMLAEVTDENDLKTLTLPELILCQYEKGKFCDIKSYKMRKRIEQQLRVAFEELNNQLIKFDPKIFADDHDGPNVISPISPIAIDNAKRVNILYEKLLRVCPIGKFNYLKSLFYYVRKVSKALLECQKRSKISSKILNEASYFSILQQSPAAILCSMIIKDGISPKFMDDLAKEMRVDLVSTLCSVLCPHHIPSHYLNGYPNEFVLTDACHPALCELIESHLSVEKHTKPELSSLMVQNHFENDDTDGGSINDDKINADLVEYFNVKSPILVEMLKLLKLVKSTECQEYTLTANSPLMKWIEMIQYNFGSSVMFDTTQVVALALHPRIYSGHSTVMKVLESHAVKGNLLALYELFKFIDNDNSTLNFTENSSSFKTLKVSVLSQLTIEREDIKYALQINDDFETKCEVILELIDCSDHYLDSKNAINSIKSCIGNVNYELVLQSNPTELNEMLKNKLNEIEFYTKIAELSGLKSWKDAQQLLKGIDILTMIKSKKRYPLAVEWFNIRKWDDETIDLQIELLIFAYCESGDLNCLDQLLVSSSKKHIDSLSLITKVIPKIEDLKSRQFLVNLILQNHSKRLQNDQIEYYNNYLTGLKLILLLPQNVQTYYLHLIANPLLIIEQTLMNIEYESLSDLLKNNEIQNIDYLIERYAQKAVEIVIYDIPSSGSGSVISDATMISSSIVESQSTKFVMPSNIPSRDQWIPDAKVTHCMLCKIERFSMLNRRHHCRRCGRIICGNCSQNTLLISEINPDAAVRVCNDCYVETRRISRKESVISNGSSIQSSNKHAVWLLTCDDLQNESVRSEFYYESAPSVSLCLALLKLHSNNDRRCKVIVEMICKPLLETVVSNQVDYALVIGMIRSLLISTKISIDDENVEMINSSDFLLRRLEAIRMLINANCNTKEMISYILSNNENSFIKLQEKLIEKERFELSRDLAMKFGFDLKSIWKTNAFICLKHQQFAEAREKFRQCMEINKENNKVLEEIVIFLEKQRNMSSVQLRDQCKQIRNGKYTFFDPNQYLEGSESIISTVVYKEIVYYLNTYGTKEDIIKFYAKHSAWKHAFEIIIADGTSHYANIFTKEVFMTAVKYGALSNLLTTISSIDPTLNRSWKLLISTCKYLTQNSLFHVLHVLQIFMNDYLRAAMTQINCFFLNPPAADYIELNNRIDHLHTAKQHCRTHLSRNLNDYHSGCLKMDASNVMRQIRTINLQIEISTKFAENNVKGFLPFDVQSESGDHSPLKSLPTLLDYSKSRKTELSALVIVHYGASIAEGFTFSQQIIKDYNLDAAQVYRLAGRTLVQYKEKNIIKSAQELVECIRGTVNDSSSTLCDDVVSACIRSCNTNELIEPLIKLYSNDINKIDAYILSGKLTMAYLLANRMDRVADVRRVLEAAIRTNHGQIKDICEEWLYKRGRVMNE